MCTCSVVWNGWDWGMSGRTRTRSSAWLAVSDSASATQASAISGFGEASATQLKGEIETNRLEPAGAAGGLGGHGPGCKAAKLEKHSGPSKQALGSFNARHPAPLLFRWMASTRTLLGLFGIWCGSTCRVLCQQLLATAPSSRLTARSRRRVCGGVHCPC